MALAPRQTGSSQKIFILAAALQAGAHADDVIDGRRPVRAAQPRRPERAVRDHRRRRAASPTSLRAMTWYSINCAYARLAQIVGLNRVVDTTYRDGRVAVPLRGPDRSRSRRRCSRSPRWPPAPTRCRRSTWRRAPRRSPTTACTWSRTTSSTIDRLAAASGRLPARRSRACRCSTAASPCRPSTCSRACCVSGTGRHYPLQRSRRRQDRHPGQQHQRLVRRLHPQPHHGGVGRRPRRLHADGQRARVRRRNGSRAVGTRPRSGSTYMDQALHVPPGATTGRRRRLRPAPPARLFLPGQRVRLPDQRLRPARPIAPAAARSARGEPAGFASPEAPPPTAPPATTAPRRTARRRCRCRCTAESTAGTTIPPDVLDPRAPVNTVPLDYRIARVLTDDLLALQRVDTAIDQLGHRRADLPERAAADAARPPWPRTTAADRRADRPPARAERGGRGGRADRRRAHHPARAPAGPAEDGDRAA